MCMHCTRTTINVRCAGDSARNRLLPSHMTKGKSESQQCPNLCNDSLPISSNNMDVRESARDQLSRFREFAPHVTEIYDTANATARSGMAVGSRPISTTRAERRMCEEPPNLGAVFCACFISRGRTVLVSSSRRSCSRHPAPFTAGKGCSKDGGRRTQLFLRPKQ